MKDSFRKFLSNKNTVTIFGIILCVIILFIGYYYRISQKVALTRVPYANQEIKPKTKITANMINYMNVPAAFLVGSYYNTQEDIVGKYSQYNTRIIEGSLFYKDLLTTSNLLPNSAFLNVKKNETVVNYKVNMDTTYANSMQPDDVINIYFKAKSDDGTIMFGKFISNITILDVKDGEGRHVFDDSADVRTPAYMMFALPEDMHLLFRKAIYLSDSYGVELILVPNTQELTKENTVYVSSKDIQNFINEKTKMVSVDEILTSTKDDVTTDDDSSDNNANDNS
ncbi:MAG: SAF domain-containing protein [Bacilli bacterium]|nr:SAF domain-containing protein [Bacilli bacterium]